jgi:hypothetical protein
MNLDKRAREEILTSQIGCMMQQAANASDTPDRGLLRIRNKVLKLLDKHEVGQADAILALGTIIIDVMIEGRMEVLKRDAKTLQETGGVSPTDAGIIGNKKGDS